MTTRTIDMDHYRQLRRGGNPARYAAELARRTDYDAVAATLDWREQSAGTSPPWTRADLEQRGDITVRIAFAQDWGFSAEDMGVQCELTSIRRPGVRGWYRDDYGDDYPPHWWLRVVQVDRGAWCLIDGSPVYDDLLAYYMRYTGMSRAVARQTAQAAARDAMDYAARVVTSDVVPVTVVVEVLIDGEQVGSDSLGGVCIDTDKDVRGQVLAAAYDNDVVGAALADADAGMGDTLTRAVSRIRRHDATLANLVALTDALHAVAGARL